jgi:hypothetical protein
MKMKKLRYWYDVRLTGLTGQPKQRNNVETVIEPAKTDMTTAFDFGKFDEGIWEAFMAWTTYDEVL